MIRLTEIEIENFGRHRRIHQPLRGNIIGLTGPNGKGKSTILQAIQFAVTGTIDHPDPLNKFIRQGTRGGVAKNATVTLKFEADGRKGSITRKITKTSTSRELTLEGLKAPLSADKAVAETMFQLLEVDKRAINSTVFIKQGAIADMFGDETKRREFYTRLLMLGHLAKLAEVIEVSRKSVGSSIVDLAIPLDEAETALTEATAEFVDADSRLSQAIDCTPFLYMANRLAILFGDQASAGVAVAQERLKLGDDPEGLLLELAFMTNRDIAERAKIATDRLAHANANSAWSAAHLSLKTMEELSKDYADWKSVEIRLAGAVAAASIPDQTDAMTILQRKIDACDVIAHCEGHLPGLKFASEFATAQERGLFDAQAEQQKPLRDAETLYDGLKRDLEMRNRILNEIKTVTDGCALTQCVVCGSGVANTDYLTSTAERLTAEVAAARTAFWIEKDKLAECERVYYVAKAEAQSRLNELNAMQARHDEATLALEGEAPDRAGLVARLANVRALQESYLTSKVEVTRLQEEVNKLISKIGGKGEPSEKMLTCARILESTTKAACVPWDPALDVADRELEEQMKERATKTAALHASMAQLQSSKEWLSRVELELQTLAQEAASKLPEPFYTPGSVITANWAEAVVGRLQSAQAEFNQLQGMREAARTAMTFAQNRVIETELKIENQKQRQALVDRLAKLRDAFKPSGVSLEYLDYKFSQVAASASDYLAESGADFTVVASPGEPLAFDFIRMEPGEEWLTQSRLSGGQKVRLAVATLRAIHSLVVPNVGLLVLDEPTTHLDAEAKLEMAEMLRRIGTEGGLQILVCDHDPVLIDAFSSTIEIPE